MDKPIRRIYVLRGLPASGKSTWAINWVKLDPAHRLRINKDLLRSMFGFTWGIKSETVTYEAYMKILYEAMNQGFDVVMDSTHLKPTSVYEIHSEVHNFNKDNGKYQYIIEEKWFPLSVSKCITRDSKRDKPVGDKVIMNMFEKHKNLLTFHGTTM